MPRLPAAGEWLGRVPETLLMPYRVTKTYGHDIGLSCCFRQWRAESHCRQLHGYALAVTLTFEAKTLDNNNWVVDFGALKQIKQYLVDTFDHTLVVADDDPELDTFRLLHAKRLVDLRVVRATGCEAFAFMVAQRVQDWMVGVGCVPRVRLVSVEVREHGANGAAYHAYP